MTGMGKDGAQGLHELRVRGGRVIAQDKASSVIYGMNREVVDRGDAHEVVPVDQIALRLCALEKRDACEECPMKLNERYDLENMKNRAEEMVFEAIEKQIEKGADMCTCEECVLDLAAYTLNRVKPRYYTSLLAPLAPRPEAARKEQVEIDLAIASGLKKLKSHRHHG